MDTADSERLIGALAEHEVVHEAGGCACPCYEAMRVFALGTRQEKISKALLALEDPAKLAALTLAEAITGLAAEAAREAKEAGRDKEDVDLAEALKAVFGDAVFVIPEAEMFDMKGEPIQ